MLQRSAVIELLGAKDLFAAHDGLLSDAAALRCIIDLPPDLDELYDTERELVEQFLASAKQQGACAPTSPATCPPAVVCLTQVAGPEET